MAVDIGAEATNRGTSTGSGHTLVSKATPASIGGTITSIDIWAFINITGLRIGTFYTTNGNTLKCRDSVALANITAGSKVTRSVDSGSNPLAIAVEIGDYIGCYYTGGDLETDTTGGSGMWYVANEEHIDPDDEATYNLSAPFEISLGGYIEVVGWTGKISEVTNPAKIMGVDVANIAEVKRVS